jgi:hypothetical protein
MTQAPRTDGVSGREGRGSGCRRWTATRSRAPSHARPVTIAMFKNEQRSFKKVASMVPSKRQNDFGHPMEDLTYE